METNAEEVNNGHWWLMAAGAAAIVLSVGLQFVDHSLSTSDKEVRLEKTLIELRSAQHLVGSGASVRRRDSVPVLRESAGHHSSGHESAHASKEESTTEHSVEDHSGESSAARHEDEH